MPKITPFLWFNGEAEPAARFYTSLFKDSRVTRIFRWPEDGPGAKKGDVLTVEFEIEGQAITAMNGGPNYKLTPAVSFMVNVQSQAELDALWDKLGAEGGAPMACGWITDRFGLTWQIVPDTLLGYLNDPDPVKAQRSMKAMMGMIKFDMAELQRAHDVG